MLTLCPTGKRGPTKAGLNCRFVLRGKRFSLCTAWADQSIRYQPLTERYDCLALLAAHRWVVSNSQTHTELDLCLGRRKRDPSVHELERLDAKPVNTAPLPNQPSRSCRCTHRSPRHGFISSLGLMEAIFFRPNRFERQKPSESWHILPDIPRGRY